MVYTIGTITNFWSSYIKNYLRSGLAINQNGIVKNTTGLTQASGFTAPSVSGDSLVFTGVERIKINNGAFTQVGVPFSCECSVMFPTVPTSAQHIISFGGNTTSTTTTETPQITGVSFDPAIGIESYSQLSGARTDLTFRTTANVAANTWYKIGLMLYNSGGLRARGYVDNVQVFDQSFPGSTARTTGLGIGGLPGAAAGITRFGFTGQIKNIYIGQSLFWPI